MKIKTIQASPLSIRASLKPDTVNDEKRTVDVVFSMGAKVLRSTWMDGQFLEELVMTPEACRLDRMNNGAPFLNTHDGSDALRVYGVVEPGTAKVVKGEGICTVRFDTAENDPDADKLFRKIKAGIVTNVSVGYRSHTIEKIVKEGEKIPTYRVTSWTPFEVSAVPMGADDGAGFRSANEQQTNEVTITTRGEDPITNKEDGQDMKTPEQLEAERQAEIAKRAAEIEAEVAKRTQIARERDAGIQHACRSAKLGDEFAQNLIKNDKITLDAARALVIDELAKRDAATPTDPHVRVTAVEGQDERDKWVRAVSAGVFESAGPNSHVAAAHARAQRGELGTGVLAREFKTVDLDGGQFRGMRFSDIARSVLERAGKSHKNLYGEQLIKAALATRATTGDFAVLLENITNKSMRAAYAVQADTWREWCGVESVKDYREVTRLMQGAFSGALPVVGEGGEYTNTSIPDGSSIAISTEKRGEIITLTREAMINDDIGALVDVASRFGRKAGQSTEIVAYQQLALNTGLGPDQADTQPYFHSNRSNVANAAALSVAAIDLDIQKMRAQTFGQDFLDVRPSILLLPIGLESAAKIINESAFDHTSALDGKPNPVRGAFAKIVSSPRLTASTTRRYLFESTKSAFKMVFLDQSGEGPTLESEEGFRVDGTQWKARIEFKFNSFDPKLAVTNAGT